MLLAYRKGLTDMVTTTPQRAATATILTLSTAFSLAACAGISDAAPTAAPRTQAQPIAAVTTATTTIDAFDTLQPATLDTLVSAEQLNVVIDDAIYPVQLIGVDVPESHAAEARSLVEELIGSSGSHKLWLEFDDALGRLDLSGDSAENIANTAPALQAYVWTSHPHTGQLDKMLNLAQIEIGLAAVADVHSDNPEVSVTPDAGPNTPTYTHETQFLRAEGYARDRGFGLWSDQDTLHA